jgi:protein-disulfide isomerase
MSTEADPPSSATAPPSSATAPPSSAPPAGTAPPPDTAPPPNGDASASPDGGASGRGGSTRGMLAPVVVLLVVAALAIAAMTGGSSDDDGGPSTAAPEGTAADPSADPSADPGADIAEELAVEPDPGQQETIEAEQQAQEQARAQLAALATREADDPRALGDVDAPVVMIEWADFLCPFCGVFARDTEPELIERYVETGVLRIEWRDLPFQGEEAVLAAIGGQAAAEQDAFWAYHEALFTADLRRSDGRMSREFLLAVAAELDLDVGAFDAALDDPALAEQVQAEAVQAQSLGITGTPAFIVGGYPVVGAQPLEAFVNVIENAAIEAGAQLP